MAKRLVIIESNPARAKAAGSLGDATFHSQLSTQSSNFAGNVKFTNAKSQGEHLGMSDGHTNDYLLILLSGKLASE